MQELRDQYPIHKEGMFQWLQNLQIHNLPTLPFSYIVLLSYHFSPPPPFPSLLCQSILLFCFPIGLIKLSCRVSKPIRDHRRVFFLAAQQTPADTKNKHGENFLSPFIADVECVLLLL